MESDSCRGCRWCGREIVFSTSYFDPVSFWFHPHTGHVHCRATDLIPATNSFGKQIPRPESEYRAEPKEE